jgi:hypothetical protein
MMTETELVSETLVFDSILTLIAQEDFITFSRIVSYVFLGQLVHSRMPYRSVCSTIRHYATQNTDSN